MKLRRAICRHLMVLATTLLTFAVAAQEPVLEVKNGAQVKQWTRASLLAEARDIHIAKDSAYKRSMNYRAVALAKLLPDAATLESVQLVASDGFVANIAGKDLAGKGQPYLAIETVEQPWPPVDPNNPSKTASAGPFYLVWLTPEAGNITNELWPYQVATIKVELPLPKRHPQIIPQKAPAASYQQALRGMAVYVKNCSVCHQINGGGDAQIGPDLNQPYSPTTYFQDTYLRKMIRQPSSVRSWKTSLMPGFDEKTISVAQMDDLIVYFQHMAKARK